MRESETVFCFFERSESQMPTQLMLELVILLDCVNVSVNSSYIYFFVTTNEKCV